MEGWQLPTGRGKLAVQGEGTVVQEGETEDPNGGNSSLGGGKSSRWGEEKIAQREGNRSPGRGGNNRKI